MLLTSWAPPGERPKPPPLWLVSNGYRTEGPLTTTALVRGAERGLSRSTYVRHDKTPVWRPLGELREVRAADEPAFERKRRLETMRPLFALETLLRLADRPVDVLGLTLAVAARRFGADFGFVHAFEADRETPVTRHAFGAGASGRIGAPLLPNDVLMRVARGSMLAIGDVHKHHAFRAAASRLGGRSGEVLGVAMVPIVSARGVSAMLELGRVDHAFRASDRAGLVAVAELSASRLS